MCKYWHLLYWRYFVDMSKITPRSHLSSTFLCQPCLGSRKSVWCLLQPRSAMATEVEKYSASRGIRSVRRPADSSSNAQVFFPCQWGEERKKRRKLSYIQHPNYSSIKSNETGGQVRFCRQRSPHPILAKSPSRSFSTRCSIPVRHFPVKLDLLTAS